MNQNPVNQLCTALSAERGALVNFVALLEREQGMLMESRTDQLLELSEKKTTDALSLDELAATRHSLLQKHLTQFSAEAIRAWLGKHSPEGLVIWQEILALAERARQLNRTNGELIQIKLRHNQQSLAVLSNAVNHANIYGPDGQPSFAPGSGRSLGSG